MLLRLAAEIPSRDPARGLVREELTGRRYEDAKPPALFDLLGRLVRRLGSLVSNAAGGIGQGTLAGIVLVGLLLLVAVVVLVRVGPRRRRGTGGAALFSGAQVLSAGEHRSQAESAAARGAYDEAIRERLRAAARELEDRGVLPPRPGRTAGELAREVGQVALTGPLTAAAHVFDEVWYGGRAGDAAGYQVVADADDAVRAARLVAP